MQRVPYAAAALLALGISGCAAAATEETPAPAPAAAPPQPAPDRAAPSPALTPIADRLAKSATVRLTAVVARLSAKERQMLPPLIDAAREQDGIYWRQAYGDRDALLARVTDPEMRRFVEI